MMQSPLYIQSNQEKSTDMNDLRVRVLLTMQVALLGMITLETCSVMVSFTAEKIEFRIRFNKPIGDDERERVSEIETELLADFGSMSVSGSAEDCSFPERIILNEGEILVFSRARE